MKEVYVNLNDKEVGFKLTSGEIANLESRMGGKPITELLQDSSVTMIATLLKHMRRWEEPTFSQGDAYDLMDELVDAGMTLTDIYWKIFAPVCVKSGIISEASLKQAEEGSTEEKN